MRSGTSVPLLLALVCVLCPFAAGCGGGGGGERAANLSDEQIDNLVRRSYQYVAMYNVNNKFARIQGGWNTIRRDTQLKDHTLRSIARPNNDTLYISCLLDLRTDPVILEIPAFASNYVSLMVTGYDHYVNIPLSSRLGDFRAPLKLLLYSARTDGYAGEPVEGVDRTFEATGDFVSAVFRVMPHASDPEQFGRVVAQMQSVGLTTLSVFLGRAAKPIDDVVFPAVGETDADVFGTNLLEVMQFVLNHTTIDVADPEDRDVLAAYAPLGVVPGRPYDAQRVAAVDGARLRTVAEHVQQALLARATDQARQDAMRPLRFQPKGKTDLETVLAVSVY